MARTQIKRSATRRHSNESGDDTLSAVALIELVRDLIEEHLRQLLEARLTDPYLISRAQAEHSRRR